ncbi:MAG: hypothetical protein ABIA63_13865 [bacterium]
MKLKISFILLIISLLCLNCQNNLFQPLSADSDENPNSLVLQGRKFFEENKYELAAEKFAMAAKLEPEKSEAWYWHAKSVLRQYGVTAITVKEIIEDAEEGLDKIPILGDPLPENVKACSAGADTSSADSQCYHDYLKSKMNQMDTIYYPNETAWNDLRHIVPRANDPLYGIGDANDGVISYKMITYDYFLCATLVSIFRLLDTKTYIPGGQPLNKPDGHISHQVKAEWDAFLVFRGINPNTVNLNLADILDISSNPWDLNQNISQSSDLLDASAKTSLGTFNEQIDKAQASEKAVDNLQNTLGDMSIKMKYYFYGDSSDNDFDWWDIDGDGKMDKMVWIDTSGNNRLDLYLPANKWDTFLVYQGKVPNGQMRKADSVNKKGYLDEHVLESKGGKYDPDSTIDKTIRFRRNDIVLLFGGSTVLNWHMDTIKFDTVYIPAVTQRSGEWIGGDYGVDEELLDGKDNDGDGLKDEDTRNTAGIDDDNDWFDTDNNGSLDIMIWTDKNENKFIDVIHNGTNYYLCSPRHRTDFPGAYNSMYDPGDKDDKDKIERCKVIVNREVDANPNSYFTRSDTAGCLRKPLFTLKRSEWQDSGFSCEEWISGDFGIDEDIKDNWDNDWDMISDEDCRDPLKQY